MGFGHGSGIKYTNFANDAIGKATSEWSGITVIRRNNIDETIGTMEGRVEAERSEILISGNDCKFVEGKSHDIQRALDRGISVRILAVSPASEGAHTLALVDDRFLTA